jgi:uncharacterized protein involved in outer membrane biogenesis
MPDTTSHQDAGHKHGGKKKKILLGLLATLIAIPVIAIIFILTFDWNKARPWLNAKVSEAIERPFAIRGNLAVEWEVPAKRMAPSDRHLRDWLPWPHLIANDVHVGNPAAMKQMDMARVRQFSFSLNPFGLLHHTIGIPVLRFDSPYVELQRTDATHYNWAYKKKDDKESKWELDLERVVLTDGVLRVVDSVTKADVTAHIRTLDNDAKYGIGFKVDGSYNGAPVTGGGKVGQVLSLKDQNTPYPVQADMRSGQSRIAVEGTVTSPAKLAAVDLQLTLAGRSMARLYNFTGITLPETPAFSTSGHLKGELDREYGRWTYENFKGKVGDSDIGGKLVYEGGKPRGKLSGNVATQQLLFSDLAPLIGGDSNESKKARGVDTVQPGGKVLPVEEFRTERWKAIDADVRYTAEKIRRDKTLPINKLSTHLIMKDGVISLAPLDFGVAGGTLRSTIRLDGSGAKGNTIAATAKVAARHIQIKQLFPTIEKMQATVGQINGDAQLSATGTSVAALLGSSNGEVKALVSEGTISKMLLEMAGLNVGNIVVTKLFGDKTVQLNCLAADFDVNKGVAQSNVFVVDTEEAIISVGGTVNLANEQLDFTIKPETKALRLFTLRAPLYVRGPFSKPDVSVDKKTLALKAGGAAVLATVAAPVAALLPLINTGPGEQSPCGRLVALAKEKPTAPPPGKAKTH